MQKAIEVKQLRSFGLLVGGIFAIIGLLPPLLRGQELKLWALILAGALIIPALILPRSLAPIYRMWMTIGDVLGWINTRLILSVVFYGMFAPVGLVMRLFSKDLLRLKLDPESKTYRVMRSPRPASHMKRQF